MNLALWLKSRFYPWFPSWGSKWHEKRRKGLAYRYCPRKVLECQQEQDRIFWSRFLHPKKGGRFLEIDGDGVTGSQSLGLELLHGWSGEVYVHAGKPLERAKTMRECRVLAKEQGFPEAKQVDLLVIRRPIESDFVFKALRTAKLQSNWVIVENRDPDARWCRLLEDSGYRLRFFFHDDEYYEFQS